LSKIAPWRPPGTNFWDGLGNCPKLFPGGLLGPISGPALEIAQIGGTGSLLGIISGQALEILQNDSLEASWDQFLRQAWKLSKIDPWRPPGTNFWTIPGNGPKWLPGSFLGPISGPALEIAQNGSLEASWDQFLNKPWKLHKIVPRRPPGINFWGRLGNCPKSLPGSLLGPISGIGHLLGALGKIRYWESKLLGALGRLLCGLLGGSWEALVVHLILSRRNRSQTLFSSVQLVQNTELGSWVQISGIRYRGSDTGIRYRGSDIGDRISGSDINKISGIGYRGSDIVYPISGIRYRASLGWLLGRS